MFHFKQLIVCAAMYKLTPQYIVAYDQVTSELSPLHSAKVVPYMYINFSPVLVSKLYIMPNHIPKYPVKLKVPCRCDLAVFIAIST